MPDWITLVPLAKPPGPPVVPDRRPPPVMRENTAWMRPGVGDTTALARGASLDAPPTVLAPAGDGHEDLFQTRRLAPPPPADVTLRTMSPYLQDQPANLRQHVYAWATTVLRWDTAQRRLGAANPLPPPGRLQIAPEYAWHIATRDRCPIRAAWEQVSLTVQHELARIIESTDAPPNEWVQALHAAGRRGPAPAGGAWWQHLRHALAR